MIREVILNSFARRVFSILADKLGINAVHVYELWENDQLIFYPDVPGRLTPTMYDSLIKLEKRASKLVDAGKKIYLVYDMGFNKIGVTGLFFESWSIDFSKTAKRHFRMFKEGLRKVSKVKFANPELIFLTIQATDKYPFNIFIDDDLDKRYLEKAMAVISLHYENWEV